jgi:hypothetical protein
MKEFAVEVAKIMELSLRATAGMSELITLEAGNRLSPTNMRASIKLIEDQLAAALRAAAKLREKYER